MDMHPSGLPHLVGPEGAPFPHPDYSHSFRYLPNNVVSELPPPNVQALSMARSNPHPLKVRAAPSSPRGAAAPHPLRLRTDGSKPGSPRERLPSSPSHLLLTPMTTPLPVLPSPSSPPLGIAPAEVTIDTVGATPLPVLPNLSSPPLAIAPAEVTVDAVGTVDFHQVIESSTSKD